jgi:hypothetical protein
MSSPLYTASTKKCPIPKPKIDWDNMCGPVLYVTDGSFHALTLWEMVKLNLGLTSVERLNRNHLPQESEQ